MASRITVAVADDQRLVREGLLTMLRLMPEVEVVGAAADGEQALALVADRRPAVMLMDLRMPRCDGVEATRRIRERYPQTRVVVLTTYADDESVFGALEAGARGYLTKDAGPEELLRAIQAVHAGQALLDPSVQARLLDRFGEPARRAGSTLPDGLTPREVEVLRLIAQGLSNRQIQERLFVTEATVKSHVNSILAKTGLRDRAQAVSYAFRNGLAGGASPADAGSSR
ncbi:MAG TPA: response regulator transcription factor [Candidatus Dormibacteraeota bacterium]|nr:response regulator transcription factor [Candidatus Dormibacteraeota bacterium]